MVEQDWMKKLPVPHNHSPRPVVPKSRLESRESPGIHGIYFPSNCRLLKRGGASCFLHPQCIDINPNNNELLTCRSDRFSAR